ncbi:MAG: 30S ribosomal protein S4 [bacterium]|nr:30S ribosomal protein S4 [bacterium]
MAKILEKTERRLGEKLFIKGARCAGPKCALVRKSNPPGIHGKKRRRGLSEYGQLLKEKQKVRFLYGLDDKDIARYSREAVQKSGLFSDVLITSLESRLDNVVYRLGFAESRRQSRQLVGHGHVTVNGRTLSIPSYQLKKNDQISLKDRSLSGPIFENLTEKLKKYEPPKWLGLDKDKKVGTVMGKPELDSMEISADIMKIKEFYSR